MDSLWESAVDDFEIGEESRHLREVGEPFLRETLAEERRNDGQRALLVDFGCWSGRHLPLLAGVARAIGTRDPDSCVLGIDRPQAMQRLAEARRRHPTIGLLDTGLAETTLPNESVSGGVSWRVLHNLWRPGELTAAVTEMQRVLKIGAALVVSVRAVRPGMAQHRQGPLRRRSVVAGRERVDLYFSECTATALFAAHDFELCNAPVLFTESEWWGDIRAENAYWMLLLRKRATATRRARPFDHLGASTGRGAR